MGKYEEMRNCLNGDSHNRSFFFKKLFGAAWLKPLLIFVSAAERCPVICNDNST
jgi:hypothetical protein